MQASQMVLSESLESEAIHSAGSGSPSAGKALESPLILASSWLGCKCTG
jgi:hypothetical protein